MISVIIPCYNVEEFVERAVDSVLTGVFQDFEIILIDDGSSDNTYNVCKKLEKKDSRIKAYSIEHAGVSNARNKGIELAKGEYIAFIDADDFVLQDYLYELYRNASLYDLDWVVCGFYKERSDKNNNPYIERRDFVFVTDVLYLKEKIKLLPSKVFYSRRFQNIPSNAMCLYRRSIIVDNNLKIDCEVAFGEDLLFNYVFSHYVRRFGYISEPLYVYTHNIKSASHNDENTSLQSIIFLMEKIEKCRLSFKEDLSKNELSFFLAHCWYYFKTERACRKLKEKRNLRKELIEEINKNKYTKYLWEQINPDNILDEISLKFLIILLKNKPSEIMQTLHSLWHYL